ncbi:hypothetical protein BDQ17DRAFT_1381001 [Cyathus striatus]|nr:hypothetical protein BDQ17DRAFT_1381001 [Cyathus striatus]
MMQQIIFTAFISAALDCCTAPLPHSTPTPSLECSEVQTHITCLLHPIRYDDRLYLRRAPRRMVVVPRRIVIADVDVMPFETRRTEVKNREPRVEI